MEKFVTEAHQAAAKEAIRRLVNIESVLDESKAAPGQPFGPGPVAALDEVLKICGGLGFKTYKDPAGYYGYAETGSGEELFGLLCHMDVVPAADQSGWETNPFEMIERDGLMIGRGTQDDKGPSMAALFAVKALMDAGVVFNKRVRFIFGTDEENLWRCLAKYNENGEEAITMGFAPDAEFPLIYAEKGLLDAYLIGPGSTEFEIHAGSALNVVPDKAVLSKMSSEVAELVKEKLTKLGFDFVAEDDTITVNGKGIHSMKAPEGVNALCRLAMAMSDVIVFGPLDFLGRLVGEDATGESVVGRIEDVQSGGLTMNFATLDVTPEETRIGVDMRIPVSFSKEDVAEKLRVKALEYGLAYEEFDYLAPLYVPVDSALVQTLMSVYREFTGDMTEPMVSGGATFARMMKNTVAFGAMFPDTPDFMHQANEQWSLENLYKVMDIYAEAVYRLCV
ncbi:MAG: M20 family metallopeptidase [Streptococcaceae bacterium]|jgi:predicted dipeptidase|nr:M20 family metallopeptidase [Streptococcaceae bacterium]